MKRLFQLALFAAIAWYGWQHRGTLLHPEPTDEAVIVNTIDAAMVRVRLIVDGQTLVREVIEPGTSTTLPFHLKHASDFQLEWQYRGREGRANWRGGLVTPGPVPLRTTLTALADGTAMVTSEAMVKGASGH
jgi:hypothetical protein